MNHFRNVLGLRLDDVGACSKRYEVYSDWDWGWRRFKVSANWLFLKYLPPFKKWGPYREMTPDEWLKIYRLLERYKAKLTVAVTAAWPKSKNRLISFPHKFPEEAAVLKEGVSKGLIEIANHGLTHCVLENNDFKPKWFSSNRRYHREFWKWIPPEVQEDHIQKSQEILQQFFQTEVVTFVPPGNVFTEMTLEIAERFGLRYVSCNTMPRVWGGIAIVGERQVSSFHDKDIVMNGVSWLCKLLRNNIGKQFCFIKDLGEMMLASTRKEIIWLSK